ncbi:MAG: hypothetical protein JNK72_20825 [Myxococcales bacterium]|nr:hypothetical protein [Myxococcales bacterium]
MLVLAVTLPMQFAAAAGAELTGGYDSTVLNQTTLRYGDGWLARGALDAQLGYRGDTVRHLLRVRAEGYYLSNEGRLFTQGDYLLINRYMFQWEPSDDWQIGFEGTYSIGRSGLLLGRTNSTDLQFAPGIAGEYIANAHVRRGWSERNQIQIGGGVQGRHAVSLPPGIPRQNMLTFTANGEYARDLSEKNVGIVGARGEYFLIDGFLDWVPRATGYLGFRRRWNEEVTTTLLAGVDNLRDQYDSSNWFTGPYLNGGINLQLTDQHLVLGFNARYEYAIVAAARCAVPVANNNVCPREAVVAGGTGRVLGTDFNAVWRPGDSHQWALFAEVNADYGVTQNYAIDRTGTPDLTRIVDVGNINLSAGGGARFIANRNVSFFTRYNFLYSYIDLPQLPAFLPEIVRHVVTAGIIVAWNSAGDGAATESLIPYEEAEATHLARNNEDNQSSGGGDEDGAMPDPFAMSTDAPSGDDSNSNSNDTNNAAGGAPEVQPLPGGSATPDSLPVGPTSTRRATQNATRVSTQPLTQTGRSRRGAAGGATGGAGGGDSDTSGAPQGGDSR